MTAPVIDFRPARLPIFLSADSSSTFTLVFPNSYDVLASNNWLMELIFEDAVVDTRTVGVSGQNMTLSWTGAETRGYYTSGYDKMTWRLKDLALDKTILAGPVTVAEVGWAGIGRTLRNTVSLTVSDTTVTLTLPNLGGSSTPGAGSGDLLAANNLDDVDDAATALANLGGVDSAAVTAAVSAHAASTDPHGDRAHAEALITSLIGAAPETLNALNELAAALGNDPNFATTMATALAARVEKSTFDANSLLIADTDNTPTALVVSASRLVGRKATGGIDDLTPDEIRILAEVNNARVRHVPHAYYTGVTTGFGTPMFRPGHTSSTLVVNTGQMMIARGHLAPGTITKLCFQIIATALTAGQHIEIACYKEDDTARSLPTVLAWVETIVVGASTGVFDVSTATDRAIPDGYAIGVLNPTGNSGTVTMASWGGTDGWFVSGHGLAARITLNAAGLATAPLDMSAYAAAGSSGLSTPYFQTQTTTCPAVWCR